MEPKKKIERFEDLIVWQKSMSLAEDIYRVTKQGDFAKDWGLRDQVRRAAVSVPSNIAEGYERQTTQEYVRYITIAKGSVGELRTQISLAGRIGHLTPVEASALVESCQEISRMLGGLKRRLKDQKKG
jgi:four helix bundle protein